MASCSVPPLTYCAQQEQQGNTGLSKAERPLLPLPAAATWMLTKKKSSYQNFTLTSYQKKFFQ